ncbi:LysM peptidoglycan-binding domain-containing protein [Winogradskyella sp. PG-2]|uniref:LysM peptidoglycan-binding domain-containing protein n=1 Tax=Winogradskyella sp. PG-2 TaxID=754409 RepID=UPI0004588C00|nr:LysM peptidoglycan-binding domain-containing protein [Winogradskyella sp. PG-2]BAO77136.1 N-acetylmuramoyl-L-alanine amidase [Winogradskyella sp. PG-2]
MQKNYKLIFSIIALAISSLFAFAQSEIEYKDVILDGKPAKLNIATGEITLVNLEEKKADTSNVVKAIIPKQEISSDASDFYVVKQGETLYQIANRFETSLTQLKKVNNLETTIIDKGQKLVVKNFDLHIVPESKSKPINTANKNISNFHIVERGETLFGLAMRYNLTVNELKSKNSLNTDLIKVGQKLRVRDFGLSNDKADISVCTVAKGDTLYSIAKKSGTSVKALKKLNRLTNDMLMIGQILQLK